MDRRNKEGNHNGSYWVKRIQQLFVIVILSFTSIVSFGQSKIIKARRVKQHSKYSDIISNDLQGQLSFDAIQHDFIGQVSFTHDRYFHNTTLSIASDGFQGEEEFGISIKDLQLSMTYDYVTDYNDWTHYIGWHEQYTIHIKKNIDLSLSMVEIQQTDVKSQMQYQMGPTFFFMLKHDYVIALADNYMIQNTYKTNFISISVLKIFKK